MNAHQRAFFRELAPPPQLTVSQWADERRMLSAESSAEPGGWNTDRAPFQRAMMDAFNDPNVYSVVLMTSAQVGKTELVLNVLGYIMDVDAGPVLVVQPTLAMAEAFSKDRLDPMIRDTPVLAAKMKLRRRDASTTILHKSFPGGHITLAGANSPASLASRPIRFVLCDEVDRWEKGIGDEGDPLTLARKRSNNFWNAKWATVSTPTIKGYSTIESEYDASDRRRCFLACPHCGHRHELEFRHLHWKEGLPETAHFACPECACEIDEAGRQQMLSDPEWRATAPFDGVAGFFVWEAYSPWRRMADIVSDFLVAKRSSETLQVFVNTTLGETWEPTEEQADSSTLVARREPYAAQVPAGALCLVMSVDTQDDRLEAAVWGYGAGDECWVVDHRVIQGDPQRPEPWQELDELRRASYQHESGELMPVSATAIDTAGHRTNYVYDYVGPRRHERVFAIIGRDGRSRPIVSAPTKQRSGDEPRKVPLYTVGTDTCKAILRSRLAVTGPGPGYIHLPLQHQKPDLTFMFGVDEEFIAQLLAEKEITKHKNGVPYKVWIKTRSRNEATDLYNYGLAALQLVRPDYAALARRLHQPAKAAPTKVADAPAKKAPWIPKRSDWLGGRR